MDDDSCSIGVPGIPGMTRVKPEQRVKTFDHLLKAIEPIPQAQ